MRILFWLGFVLGLLVGFCLGMPTSQRIEKTLARIDRAADAVTQTLVGLEQKEP